MVKSISGPFAEWFGMRRVDGEMRPEGILGVNAEPFPPESSVFLDALTSEV